MHSLFGYSIFVIKGLERQKPRKIYVDEYVNIYIPMDLPFLREVAFLLSLKDAGCSPVGSHPAES